MNQAFYDGLVIRIRGGQYTLEEINRAIDKAAGKGFFGEDYDAIVTELKALAVKHIDDAYIGNTEPRAYDHEQDIDILANTESNIELFDIVMGLTETMPSALSKTEKAVFEKAFSVFSMARSAIGDNYVKLIIAGRRTFDQVHISKKQEVAEKLIAKDRYDLVTDINYLTPAYIALAIIDGTYTFGDVPTESKQEVASELIASGHSDLVDDPSYLPQPSEN